MNKIKKWGGMVGVFVVAVAIGYAVSATVKSFTTSEPLQIHSEQAQQWTCSMHPHVRGEEGGRCPICGMSLILVQKEQADEGMATGLSLSPNAEKLAELALSTVRRDFATEKLRLSGKLVIDETRVETISAWFPGRIEKLFIDYTGITVEKNTHMAAIYSPELLVTQKELLEAARLGSAGLLGASREKLRLWGFSAQQIKEIEKTGRIEDSLTLSTAIGGTVLKKYVNQGEYVKTGSKIYDLANLDRLWFVAEVYESDIAKISYGQKAQFVTDAYPGELFDVVITFIDPIVDPNSRTIRIRGVVDNVDRKLKPDMLAKSMVSVTYSKSGPLQDKSIKELYVCPMHPEEFSTQAGRCSLCLMPLQKAAQLGLIRAQGSDKPLLIPVSAPLITGTRAIVYVKVPNKSGRYEGREVHLGAKVGDFYIVKQGLKEGESVVVKGNFKIDSAMQLQAKPSMMQAIGGSGNAASRPNH